MSFGENMKRLREMEGITTAELAEIASVSQPMITKWETGQALPNVVAGALIAKRLGSTVEAMVSKNCD